MAVNWGLGAPQPNALNGFIEGMERGRQHRRENALMQQRRDEMEFQGQQRTLTQEQAQRERLQAAAQTLRPVYQRLRTMPYEQRRAALEQLGPRLSANGIPQEIIAGYDPTDANLDNDIMLSQRVGGEGYTLNPGDIRFGPDNQVVARGGPSQDRYIPVPQGGQLMRVPGGGGGAEEALPTIADPAQARTLPPGTRFRDPQGNIRTVPGGPASAPGGFPVVPQ